MTLDEFKHIQGSLSNSPGIYYYYENDTLLYVGKAINIKKRVSSYFRDTKQQSSRIKLMVKKISRIDFTVVESENDALILENNLIKAHKPRYNILLKDDKTYPFICIKNEPFPRILLSRKPINDGSKYYGPFTSVSLVKSFLKFFHKTYKLRTCSYHLSKENITAKKFKICLDYHIGNCKGPCEALQSESSYNKQFEEINKILKGQTGSLIKELNNSMQIAASRLDFEKAEQLKQRLKKIQEYQAKSVIVNPRLGDIDVFSIKTHEIGTYVNYLKINNGSIFFSANHKIQTGLNESIEEFMEKAIFQIRSKYNSKAPLVLGTERLSIQLNDFKYFKPIKGDKKKLVDLSILNLKAHLNHLSLNVKEKNKNKTLEELKIELHLPTLPLHIDCFDISHHQGKQVVASLVVFKNGRSNKSLYRHFAIRHGLGNNDFKSMEEVVYRHYSRQIKEGKKLPDLIIIDGGKGQLKAVIKSLNTFDMNAESITFGLAKRLECLFSCKSKDGIMINKKSPGLRLLQQIRNEAHRFAVSYHRNMSTKDLLHSQLLDIPGLGKSSTNKLLKEFKSIEKIKSATLEALTLVLGKSKANKLRLYFDDL